MRRVEAGVQASMSYCINRTVSISSTLLTPLVDDRDLSATGKMGRCDIVVVRHGDKGVAPKNVLIKGPGARQ